MRMPESVNGLEGQVGRRGAEGAASAVRLVGVRKDDRRGGRGDELRLHLDVAAAAAAGRLFVSPDRRPAPRTGPKRNGQARAGVLYA